MSTIVGPFSVIADIQAARKIQAGIVYLCKCSAKDITFEANGESVCMMIGLGLEFDA